MMKVFKKIMIGLGIILFLFCCLVGFVAYNMYKQEELLSEELGRVGKLDLFKDNYDLNIVTKDEYAIVEKTIKDYFIKYSDNLKSLRSTIDNFNFEGMFSIENFTNDGPDFISSKSKLENLKSNLNNSFDILIEMSSEAYIKNLIEKQNLDKMYKDLYIKHMLGNNVTSLDEVIKEDIENVKKTKDTFELVFNDCYNVYDFLSRNRKSYQIADGYIYFNTQALVDEYNNLLNKIIKDCNEFLEKDNKDSEKKEDANDTL